MKRGATRVILSLVLSVSMVLSGVILVFAEGPSTETNLCSSTSMEKVEVGEKFTITLALKENTTITSIACGVHFDKNLVRFVSYKGNCIDDRDEIEFPKVGGGVGSFFEVIYPELGDSGADVGMAFVGTSDTTYEAGKLVTLTFEAIAKGDITFTIYEDSEGSDGKKTDSASTGYQVSVVDSYDHQAVYLQHLFSESTTVRAAGEDRYDTAIKAANALKKVWGIEEFENIVVAYGKDFPDALSGGYLAKVKNAPILLISPSSVDKVFAYVRNNLKDGGTVYFLGGAGVIPESYLSSLNDYFQARTLEKGTPLSNATRVGGSTRYDTNLNVLNTAGVETNTDILICSSKGYADSLSASALGKPLMIVTSALKPAQIEYLSNISINRCYIIGGQGAVSSAVEDELVEIIGDENKVERLCGEDRYETSKAIAEHFFLSTSAITLAYGKAFPDGLSAGPLANSIGAPLFLVADKHDGFAHEYVNSVGASKAVTLGGTGLISDDMVTGILAKG